MRSIRNSRRAAGSWCRPRGATASSHTGGCPQTEAAGGRPGDPGGLEGADARLSDLNEVLVRGCPRLCGIYRLIAAACITRDWSSRPYRAAPATTKSASRAPHSRRPSKIFCELFIFARQTQIAVPQLVVVGDHCGPLAKPFRFLSIPTRVGSRSHARGVNSINQNPHHSLDLAIV
jgi:hypothetical protein